MPLTARIVDQTVSREMDKQSAALSGTSFSLNGGALSTKEIANQQKQQGARRLLDTLSFNILYQRITSSAVT